MGLSSGLLLLSSLLIIGPGPANASSRLDVIDLPVGFRPEGITNGEEWIAYVGSLVSEFLLHSHVFSFEMVNLIRVFTTVPWGPPPVYVYSFLDLLWLSSCCNMRAQQENYGQHRAVSAGVPNGRFQEFNVPVNE